MITKKKIIIFFLLIIIIIYYYNKIYYIILSQTYIPYKLMCVLLTFSSYIRVGDNIESSKIIIFVFTIYIFIYFVFSLII